MAKKVTSEDAAEAMVAANAGATAVVKPLSEAAKIWEEIKHKEINMFALPDQTPEKYAKPVVIDGDKLYLSYSVSSFLPALEEALSRNYVVELVERYITITRKK